MKNESKVCRVQIQAVYHSDIHKVHIELCNYKVVMIMN